MTTAASIELVGLRKTYGGIVAVEHVDLSVASGEFVTFLGPSGSGKTTTLMTIAGLEEPSGGDILMDGKPLRPVPAFRRNIGMVFQQYALFPHMTVAQNIAFPLEMRKIPRREIERRVERVIDAVGLPGHQQRLPAQLSGGQQQRVALARAIVFEPKLLLMDEPLGALDKKLREQMQGEITRLHRELGITVLYVTHDQTEALVLSERIAVFNRGRIDQIGTPVELYERPTTRFVADFLGETCFLSGTVRREAEGLAEVETRYGMLRGHNTARLKPGEAALLAVRPERISVAKPCTAVADNKIQGTLRDLIYLGQARKLIVALDGGDELRALVQPGALADGWCNPGELVGLSWSGFNCNVLRATEP
jgi:putative spermidine/putrescine transport system ATP-binding protein